MTIKTTPSTFQNSLEGQYHPPWEPQIHVKTIWKVKSTFQTHSMINLQKLQWIFSRCCISTLYKRRLLNYKRWVFSFSIKPISISGNMASESIHLLKTTKNSGLEQFLKRVSEWAEQLRIRSLGTEWQELSDIGGAPRSRAFVEPEEFELWYSRPHESYEEGAKASGLPKVGSVIRDLPA